MKKMESISHQEYLNDYFKEYIEDNSGYNSQSFIIYEINGINSVILSCRYYFLKPEIKIKYSPKNLQYYITEILIQLLKDDYDLNTINVNFIGPFTIAETTPPFNLGKFEKDRVIKMINDIFTKTL